MSRRIWFLLIDSVNGQAYRGTTSSSVSLPPSSVIDDFRDAVKAKFDQPGYLKDIPSGALLVYKNKASFDQGREGPLEEDALVEDLGTSKKEALVVVVPPAILVVPRAIQQPTIQPRLCDEPFYMDIHNATKDNGQILFSHEIPSTSLKSLYIRDSYRDIASLIMTDIRDSRSSGIKKTIITGSPGIGKSLFLIYLLWKLVKQGQRVLFIYHPYNIYYDGQGGVWMFASEKLPDDDDRSFWNATLWCLFDAKSKQKSQLDALPYECCRFVLSTSPRRDMVNDFKKPPDPQIFYMPIWTEAELKNIESFFPNVTDWLDRFKILGGIPRHVLESTSQNPTMILEVACTQCSLDDCIKKIGLNSMITENVIHSLVHITSFPPFTESSVQYASEAAVSIIVREKGINSKIMELLPSCERNPLTASLCGYIFEPYALDVLEKGGSFDCRLLLHGNTKPQSTRTHDKLYIPPSTKTVVDKVVAGQPQNQLHVPKTKNFTGIDAWIPGIGAFQITAGKTHDLEASVKDDLALLGPNADKIYWLIPRLYVDSFANDNTIDHQYAVLIPFVE